jgi:TRAP-type uncharacterized transport system fused permease subunit
LDVLAVVTATIAAVTFAATLQGYFVGRNTLAGTVALGAGTVALFDGRPVMNAVGLLLVGGVYIRQRSVHAQHREAAVTLGTNNG